MLQCVDIEERLRVVVRRIKAHVRARVLCGPSVDLSATGLHEALQARQQLGFEQAENRLGSPLGLVLLVGFSGHHHGDIGLRLRQRAGQARGQIQREKRRVARDRQQVGRLAVRQPGQKASQRARKLGIGIGPDRGLQSRIRFDKWNQFRFWS